jgi:hypothetical protein
MVGCQENPRPNPNAEPVRAPGPALQDCVALPSPTHPLQLRLYTNASPKARHLFNTLALELDGQPLLHSPHGETVRRFLAATPADPSLHNVLINGMGPELGSANSMTLIEQASGPEWQYLALDASAAYRGRLQKYRRAVLFVEPDLFVLHDQLVAGEPVTFQMRLHPLAATRVDTNWGDLRLELPQGGFRIHAPGERRVLRSWQRIESPADALLPGTVTMQLGPTNKVSRLDVLTVFGVFRGPARYDYYAFKLLESDSAVGARIHRAGFPTLVAFRSDPAAASASLTGFGFTGPVGVSILKPKPLSQ